MDIRLVALDLDGTLLDEAGEVPEINRTALARVRDCGVRVAIASGRMVARIEPTAELLGIDGAVLAYNGAMVLGPRAEGRTTIFHQPLSAEVAAELIDFALEHRYALNFYHDDTLYSQDDPALRALPELYARRTGAVYHFTDLAGLRGRSPTKVILLAEPAERERLYDHFSQALEGRANVLRSNPEYLEIMAAGIDKGTALPVLARHYGLEPSQVLAMGDADNDAAMLRAAGFSVAVANASELARSVADASTERTAAEGAVAEALERWVLGPDGCDGT